MLFCMVFIGVDPLWRPLRQDAWFAALLARMNLAQGGPRCR